MKKIVAIIALLASSSVFAGTYMGITIGKEANSSRSWHNGKHSYLVKDAYAGRVKIGYEFNQNLALETGVLGTAKIDVKNIHNKKGYSLQTKEIIVDEMGKLTMRSDKLAVSAKGGVAKVFSTNHEVAKDVYTYGVGANLDYDLSSHVIVDFETIHYFKVNKFSGLNYIGAGLIYRF